MRPGADGFGRQIRCRSIPRALRLHEVGMIKSSPQKIIAEGTDWRFLNEIKREMTGV